MCADSPKCFVFVRILIYKRPHNFNTCPPNGLPHVRAPLHLYFYVCSVDRRCQLISLHYVDVSWFSLAAVVEWYWWGTPKCSVKQPVTVPLRPPQIPHRLAWDRTGPLRWEANDQPPESCQGPVLCLWCRYSCNNMGVCGPQFSHVRVKPYTCGLHVEDGFRLTWFCTVCEKNKKISWCHLPVNWTDICSALII